jgi:cardiolipin synthase C
MRRFHLKAYGTALSLDASHGLPSFGAAVRRLVAAGATRALGALALTAAVAALSGCGTIPPNNPARNVSTALPPSPDSALVKIAQASTPSPDASGVRLMPLGIYSLEARVELAKRAQRSLDVQYYHLEGDATGRMLLRHLRDAANRGVRVRLLLDDLYTTSTDGMLRALAAHANIEVRLFNPFCCARGSSIPMRIAASLFSFGRVNHRMHNKLFVADGVMAVIGGRNIADEYFLRHSQQNFVDLDAFVVGAVVADMSAIFDSYWNADVVYPIEAIGAPLRDRKVAIEEFSRLIDTAPQAPPIEPPPVDALGYGPISEELDSARIGLIWGKARAFADPPEKPFQRGSKEAIAASVTQNVMNRIWQAKKELVISSPYMIPGRKGLESIEKLRNQDIKVTVMTNSLAATDEPLVHTGYSRYRYDMLLAGVDIYELSPSLTRSSKRLGAFGKSLGRLHSKTVVIDAETVFIGSMNLDPRSQATNTEMGMFFDSPQLAKELLRIINITKLQSAYRLRLQPDGPGIQWLATDGEKEIVLGIEPESSALLRLHNIIFGLFIPEQLL